MSHLKFHINICGHALLLKNMTHLHFIQILDVIWVQVLKIDGL